MKNKDIGALFLLAALWGSSFLFMRISAPVLGPFMVIELRVLVAGLILLMYARLIKRDLKVRERWRKYLIIGAINAAIPFTLIATATLTLNASLASILNSTTPLFGTLVACGWLKEKLTLRKIIGIVSGICGVIILIGWSPIPFTPQVMLAASLSILAAISYGFAGTYAKKAFVGVDSLSIAIGQQLGAAILLMPITAMKIPSGPVPAIVIVSMAGLALMCTAVAYIIYFYLINSIGPTKALTVTFLVPLFGTIWGIVFLSESISAGMVIGLVIILSSIFIMSDTKITQKLSLKCGKLSS